MSILRSPAAWSLMLLIVSSAPGQQVPKQQDAVPGCGTSGTIYTRTTLYFGMARPAGTITEKQWKAFVREEVSRRFPQGFTIWEALGQWRGADGQINRERSKVLLLVHPDTSPVRDSVSSLIASYKQRFQQESVLWETAKVCAAF